jgi:hypothetical protein
MNDSPPRRRDADTRSGWPNYNKIAREAATRRPPCCCLMSAGPVDRFGSAGHGLRDATRTVRTGRRAGAAALDQHHSRRTLNPEDRAKHRGVVPVGPTPPARRHRRPRRHRRGSAWDVVIHLLSPTCSAQVPGCFACIPSQVFTPRAGAMHNTPCTPPTRSSWRRITRSTLTTDELPDRSPFHGVTWSPASTPPPGDPLKATRVYHGTRVPISIRGGEGVETVWTL